MTTTRSQHGYHGTRIYRIWASIKRRCQNKNQITYPQYGGRGIKLCDEWQDFTKFLAWAHATGYTDGLTIDRLDPNGHYTPDNCKWSSYREQGTKRRNSVVVTAFGETKPLVDWFKDDRVTAAPSAIRTRLHNKEAPEVAFTRPSTRPPKPQKARPEYDVAGIRELYESGMSVTKVSKHLSIPRHIVDQVVSGLGMPLGERAYMEQAKVQGYADLPYVVAVLQGGATTRQAAEQFGVSQTTVAAKVAQVKSAAKRAKQPTTAQPTPQTTAQDLELDLIADMLRSAAKRLNMRPEALAHDMIHRLAD